MLSTAVFDSIHVRRFRNPAERTVLFDELWDDLQPLLAREGHRAFIHDCPSVRGYLGLASLLKRLWRSDDYA